MLCCKARCSNLTPVDRDELLDALETAGTQREAARDQHAAADQHTRELIALALADGIPIAQIAKRSRYHRNSIRAMRDH